MAYYLPIDCLDEIFENLEDRADLRSCLLVDRTWCQVSVRILWKNIQNYHTLIACLSDESKEILCENEITITTPTSRPPLFNYVAFVKNLSTYDIAEKTLEIQPIVSQNLDINKKRLVM